MRLTTSIAFDRPCAFCHNPAESMIYILEELPPQPDVDGEYWTRFAGFDTIYLCREHQQKCRRYRFWVREKGDPSQDEAIGDGYYRTPMGWKYRVVGNSDEIEWVRLGRDE